MTKVTELQCNGCGAPLPPPTGPTVECAFCNTVSLITKTPSASALSSGEPSTYWRPAECGLREMHAEILTQGAAIPFVVPEAIERFASQPLTSSSILLWLFSLEGSGTVSCMVGSPEQRQVVTKVGKETFVKTVTDVRYSPFSANFHVAAQLVGSTGTPASATFAKRFRNSTADPAGLRVGAEAWEPVLAPAWTSEETWTRELESLALGVRDVSAGRVIPGDIRKDMKVSAAMKHSAVLVAVETAQFGSEDSAVQFMHFGGEVWAGSQPPFDIASDRAAAAGTLEKREAQARMLTLGAFLAPLMISVMFGNLIQSKTVSAGVGIALWLLSVCLFFYGFLLARKSSAAATSQRLAASHGAAGELRERLSEAFARLDGHYGGAPSARERDFGATAQGELRAAASHSEAKQSLKDANRRYAVESEQLRRASAQAVARLSANAANKQTLLAFRFGKPDNAVLDLLSKEPSLIAQVSKVRSIGAEVHWHSQQVERLTPKLHGQIATVALAIVWLFLSGMMLAAGGAK